MITDDESRIIGNFVTTLNGLKLCNNCGHELTLLKIIITISSYEDCSYLDTTDKLYKCNNCGQIKYKINQP